MVSNLSLDENLSLHLGLNHHCILERAGACPGPGKGGSEAVAQLTGYVSLCDVISRFSHHLALSFLLVHPVAGSSLENITQLFSRLQDQSGPMARCISVGVKP